MFKFKAYYKDGDSIMSGSYFEAVSDKEAIKCAEAIYGKTLHLVIRVKKLRCYKELPSGNICGYEWEFSGIRTKNATCPNCYKQCNIDKAMV